MKLALTWPSGLRSRISSGPGSPPRKRALTDAEAHARIACRADARQAAADRCGKRQSIAAPDSNVRRCGTGRSGAPLRSKSSERAAAGAEGCGNHGAWRAGENAGRRKRSRPELRGWHRRATVRLGRCAGACWQPRRELQEIPESAARPKAHAQRVAREVVNELRMPEAHLDFRRVHVHVDFLVRQIKEQQHHRNAGGVTLRYASPIACRSSPSRTRRRLTQNIDPVAIGPLHLGTRGESGTRSVADCSSGSSCDSVIAERTGASLAGISISSSRT